MSERAERPGRIIDFGAYVSIARPDHWIKNGFILPGAALAIALYPDELRSHSLPGYAAIIAVAFAATCLLASANYTLNEWLDATFDRHHPTKMNRAAPRGKLEPRIVYSQYAVLAAIGLAAAFAINFRFFEFAVLLLVMGVVYNVAPIRSKDRAYLDVLSESLNNPIRLLLGWSAFVTSELPPLSIVACYWMGGAYLMAIKRLAEYRLIDDPQAAARYRRSFATYDEAKLLVSAFFYAINAAFFLGIFLIKYRFEYFVSFPLFALLFSWYLSLAMRARSSAADPERLYSERKFVLFFAFLLLVLIALLFIDLPFLNYFIDHNNIVIRHR